MRHPGKICKHHRFPAQVFPITFKYFFHTQRKILCIKELYNTALLQPVSVQFKVTGSLPELNHLIQSPMEKPAHVIQNPLIIFAPQKNAPAQSQQKLICFIFRFQILHLMADNMYQFCSRKVLAAIRQQKFIGPLVMAPGHQQFHDFLSGQLLHSFKGQRQQKFIQFRTGIIIVIPENHLRPQLFPVLFTDYFGIYQHLKIWKVFFFISLPYFFPVKIF